MTAITSTGIGSGVDVESIVKALVEAERAPTENRLNSREAETTVTLTSLGTLQGALSKVQDAAAPLSRESTFNRYVAQSSDETAFTATALGVTGASRHEIKVNQLAETQRLATGDFTNAQAEVGTGTLSIGTEKGGFSVAIDETNNTLIGIRDAINQASNNDSAVASIVNSDSGSKLILQAQGAGTANELNITVSGDGDGVDDDGNGLSRLTFDDTTQQLTEIAAAKDAIVEIDGQTVTASSNRLENAIEGVTIDLLDADTSETYTLEVSRDKTGVEEAVSGFVDAFNESLATINKLSSAGTNEEGEESEAGGALQGDFMLRSAMNQVRRIMGDSVAAASEGFQTLSSIGVEVQRDGTLKLDSFQLSNAIDSGADLQALFASESGIASRLNEVVGNYAGFGGLIDDREDSLQADLKTIDKDRDQLDDRIESFEQRTYAQFNSMDRIIGEMTSTQNYLKQTLDNLPGYGGGS